MPDIKTKDVVLRTIKTVDRSAVAGQRMKDAYVYAKSKAEQSVSSSEGNSEEYAADRMNEVATEVAHEAVHEVNTLGQRIVRQTVSKPQTAPIQAESFTQNAQQPHQTTDGAGSVISPDTAASMNGFIACFVGIYFLSVHGLPSVSWSAPSRFVSACDG